MDCLSVNIIPKSQYIDLATPNKRYFISKPSENDFKAECVNAYKSGVYGDIKQTAKAKRVNYSTLKHWIRQDKEVIANG